MGNEKVYQMDYSKVYHLLVSKAEKKGRTRQEVDEVIRWLTGYNQPELEEMLERPVTYGDFFLNAPKLNENRKLIKGMVCGIRVEDIEDVYKRQEYGKPSERYYSVLERAYRKYGFPMKILTEAYEISGENRRGD